jgi:cystathionine beta-lyase/cystathionine gamma-synthase
MAGRRQKRKRGPAPATRVIHAGQEPDPTTGAVMQPVYLTSTYRQPGLGEGWPFTYARGINPTRRALERNLAALEEGIDARCFASGMAAISTVTNLLSAGDQIIASERVYGGTYRLFEGLLRRNGIETAWVDTSQRRAIEAALRPNSRMLFVETPTNPTLELTDLAMASRVARRHRLRFVVDNTFMTPYFQRPIAYGADLVVHSTTKFLNGHSDSVGGCVVSRGAEDAERIAWLQNSVGAILSPVDSFLVLRGVKTLALRMERHQENAGKIASWLVRQPSIRSVNYPGLPAHPQHRLARRQMSGFGGVLSFDLGTMTRARRFFSRLKLATLAESLGGVETLASHPATMTHASLAPADRRRLGIGNGLVRLSVGVEDVDDLIEDLRGALPR